MKRISRVVTSVALAAAVLGVSSCDTQQEVRPNIVLIVIDTLRPDHLPFYGYDRDTAPFLSSLAEGGVVFERVHSTSSWTAPATASIVTSLNPLQHGVLTGFRMVASLRKIDPTITLNRIPAEVTTVAEVLQEAGYSTYAVTDNINICREEGFDQGFDRFWNYDYQGAEVINAKLQERVAEIETSAPYFIYIHYMDPHRPYHKQEPWYEAQEGERLDTIAAYDSEISYLDLKIKEMFELFGWDQNTLLVVTSDHGEEFQDHGGWDHGRNLYAEVLDVPLFFYSSADSLATGRHAMPVSTLDVLPTLRDYAGLPGDPQDAGVSLLPNLHGEGKSTEDRTFFADLRSPPWFGGRTHKAVIQDGFKYIVTLPDTEELYDINEDAAELNDLAGEHDALVEELRGRLIQFEESCYKYNQESITTELTDHEIQKLKSLGYVR